MRTSQKTIVIFAESLFDRERLRTGVLQRHEKVFCFQNELTCIDNLKIIRPDVIVIETDTQRVFQRFVFAIHALKLPCLVLVGSGIVSLGEDIEEIIGGHSLPVSIFSSQADLLKKIDYSVRKTSDASGFKNGYNVALVGSDSKIKHIKAILPTITENEDAVLITGEPGVGKELLVRSIANGGKHRNVLIKFQCSEITPDIIISMDKTQDQSPESLHTGKDGAAPLTIFLDGVDKLTVEAQSKLLLFFDDPQQTILGNLIGDGRAFRFIATANRALAPLVDSGRFRKDLYYRLNVIPISVPPLRHRKTDIPFLVDFYIITMCMALGTTLIPLSTEAQKRLIFYNWPRNLKDLETIIYRVVSTRDESVILQDDIFPISATPFTDLMHHIIDTQVMPNVIEIKNTINSQKNISLKTLCGNEERPRLC